MKTPFKTSALLSSLVLAACATTSMPPSVLVEARSTVRSAELDPDVQAHAPLELKRATDSLNRANTLHSKNQSPDEVNSAAYVALQQGKAAMATARAKSQEARLNTAELERERVRADTRSVEAQQAQAQADLARQRAAAAEQKASGAEQRASGAEQQAALAQQQASDMQQRLAELQAKQTERGLLVTLGDVLFESNSATVKPGAQDSLQKLADFLQRYPDRRVLIEGHTDSVGSTAYNEALSMRRAQSVNQALSRLGVSGDRVTAVGYGESFPVAANSTETNRALNRRVEVYIGEGDQPVRSRR